MNSHTADELRWANERICTMVNNSRSLSLDEAARVSDALKAAIALAAERDALRFALGAIAGHHQWPDALMGDKDIARTTLVALSTGEKP